MKVQFLFQPIAPDNQRLGHQLRALLAGQEGKYPRFLASIAFVKGTGVGRIYSALRAFREGGGKSRVAVGIDKRGTSKQGLDLLRGLVDELFIYKDKKRSFHPKIYLFEAPGSRAIALLGSGNMTSGGLFTNYEGHLRLDLDLKDSGDAQVFASIRSFCDGHCDEASPCVQRVTDDLMNKLKGRLMDESAAAADDDVGSEDEADSVADLFGTIEAATAPAPDVSLPGRKKTKGPQPTVLPPVTAVVVPAFWKVLSAYDVSRTSSPGQIIIPIEFKGMFPPMRQTQEADQGGKGRQWEASFACRFVDDGFQLVASDSRVIVYEPKTGHARPNTECRFTLRERTASDRLNKGDILLFRPTPGSPTAMTVERVKEGSARHKALYRVGGVRFGTTA